MAEQKPGPSLRCPCCGNTVALPAEECGQCRYNFRTGKKPAPPPSESDLAPPSRRPLIIGAIVGVLVIIVALLIFLGGKDPEPAAATPAASGGGSRLQPLPSVMQSPSLNPAPTINMTLDAAGQVEENQQQVQQLYQELQEDSQ
ncbi:MAG: hypothetical protein LBT62_01025 [Deltaproteobacteria bacterium]|jgi:hypothetical protein|nr:hypothetical protein [Deltaproteobacteria bacterium]